jgi:hypothetical protein
MASKNSVFATLENMPTAISGGELYKNNKADGKGVDLPSMSSDRSMKSKWLTDTISVTEDGFTIFVSMKNHSQLEDSGGNGGVAGQRTPSNTYFKFTVGETPTYSFYFGDDAPYYNAYLDTWKVSDIRIQWDKQIIIKMKSGEDEDEVTITNKGMKNTLANDTGTNGWIEQDFAKMNVKGMPRLLASLAPCDSNTILLLMNALKSDKTKGFFKAATELNAKDMGMYYWNANSAKAHLSPQSFTMSSTLDETFLVKPTIEFKGVKKVDTKDSYIQFQCVIEQRNDRTDNYTGRDPQDNAIFVSTIQFPGDESLLAPMGTSTEGTEVACGMEGKEGRTIKEIIPGIKNEVLEQVKITFTDGSFCVFPDAETGTFTATDKETGQMLKGKVENLILASGKWKDAYAKEKKNRVERNTSPRWTVFEGDKAVTSSIAWQEGNFLKVIVPTDGGAKLITIPTREA